MQRRKCHKCGAEEAVVGKVDGASAGSGCINTTSQRSGLNNSFISSQLRRLEVQDQRAARVVSGRALAPGLQTGTFSLCPSRDLSSEHRQSELDGFTDMGQIEEGARPKGALDQ